MKSFLKLSFLFLVFFTLNSSAQKFSQREIIEDLNYLNRSLEQTHFDLYATVSKAKFQANFDKVKKFVVQDSLNMLEATSLFQRVISKANTGHAEIDFPIGPYREYAMSGGTLFPLELAIEGEKVFIRRNFSDNEYLSAGSGILTINEQPIKEILQKIYPQLSAESIYFKNAKLEFWSFPRLYWQVFGEKETFKISVRKKGEVKNTEVAAVDLINDYELKRADIITDSRSLNFYNKIAYLKPGNFSGNEEVYQHFIDSSFAVINESASKKLIIDLRNNSGGHDAFSDYLISYLTDKPFRWYSKFLLKSSELLKEQTRLNNDTTERYFKEILIRENGVPYEYELDFYQPQSAKKRYSGDTYVLVNRHSYSMAAVAAAVLQDLKIAVIVGEETGDHPTLHASQFQYTLPNTGVIVKVPKGYIVRLNGDESERGVVPDTFIKDHLVDESDEILTTLLKKIDD